jgi:hypothetical protein
MQTLCSSKGQILELDPAELDPAELARAATQMAMEDSETDRHSSKDAILSKELSLGIPSKDLFNQRLIDNTEDFEDQVRLKMKRRSFIVSVMFLFDVKRTHMKHVFKTNAHDGLSLIDVPNHQAPGGIWKQTIYVGVGEQAPLNSTVRIHYNAYFELNDEPYDSTVR